VTAAGPGKHLWRNRFTAAVFAAIFIAGVIQWLRPLDTREPFRPPDEIELAPLKLPAAEHPVRGRLLDHEGNGVEDSLVQLLADGRPFWTYTAPDGAFAFPGLPSGAHPVVVLPDGYLPAEFTLEVPRASEAAWRLPPPDPPIEFLEPVERTDRPGQLVASIGSDAAGCEVLFRPSDRQPALTGATPRRALTDEEGHFLVEGLPHGAYDVIVLPAWARGGSWPALAGFPYVHGASPPGLRIPLESARLRGNLRDTGDSPVHGALVLVTPHEEPDRLWPPVSSDERGDFEVRDLPPGRYRVEIRTGEHTSSSLIDLAPGTSVELELGPIRTE